MNVENQWRASNKRHKTQSRRLSKLVVILTMPVKCKCWLAASTRPFRIWVRRKNGHRSTMARVRRRPWISSQHCRYLPNAPKKRMTLPIQITCNLLAAVKAFKTAFRNRCEPTKMQIQIMVLKEVTSNSTESQALSTTEMWALPQQLP